jgi:undecaprenyl-diphosphatase
VTKLGQLVDRILGLHGWAVLAVVFLAPALEASAFLGVVVPGEIAVLLGGVLAFEHRAPLPAVLAFAVTGAIIGDSVGYLVGRRWGRRLLDGSVGRLVPHQHLDRAERYLAERGGPAVFFGRFTAALRALIPGLAGMAGLHYRTFALYNAAGGLLWASGFVLLGYVAGTGWRRVEAVAKRASLLLLLALAATAALVLVVRWLIRHPDRVTAVVDRQLQRPWVAQLRDRYQRQLGFLARRLQPGGALGLSLTLSVTALVAAGWAFGAVLQDILARDELELVDQPVAVFFVGHREAWLTRLTQDITNLGSARLLLPLIVAVGVGWWRPPLRVPARRPDPAGHPQDPRPPRPPSAVHDRDRLCRHQPPVRAGQPGQARRPAARALGDRDLSSRLRLWDVTVEGFGEAGVDAGGAASGSCQSVAEFVDLLGRSEQDPPVRGAGLLAPGEVAVAEPAAQRAGGAGQMGGELG